MIPCDSCCFLMIIDAPSDFLSDKGLLLIVRRFAQSDGPWVSFPLSFGFSVFADVVGVSFLNNFSAHCLARCC